MFDEVTKKEGGKAAARRAGYVFGSTVFQEALRFLLGMTERKGKAHGRR